MNEDSRMVFENYEAKAEFYETVRTGKP